MLSALLLLSSFNLVSASYYRRVVPGTTIRTIGTPTGFISGTPIIYSSGTPTTYISGTPTTYISGTSSTTNFEVDFDRREYVVDNKIKTKYRDGRIEEITTVWYFNGYKGIFTKTTHPNGTVQKNFRKEPPSSGDIPNIAMHEFSFSNPPPGCNGFEDYITIGNILYKHMGNKLYRRITSE